MAELAVANTVIGLVSKICTCSVVGWRIIQRVTEFASNTGDVPEVLRDITEQLPVLIDKMEQLTSLGDDRLQKVDPRGALTKVVTGCQSRLNRLEKLVSKLQPRVKDSVIKKLMKAAQSVFYENEMAQILIKLESYKTTFVLNFTDITGPGTLYQNQGKLADGEELNNPALAGSEKVLVKDDASTLNAVYNLGRLYHSQGKLADAEELYNRALAGREEALGKGHASTLDTVYNLGRLYHSQGKLANAEEMYHRALAGREEALGKGHASTLDTVYNLGRLYHSQGKLANAEEMYHRALAGIEKALGKDHVSTLNTVHNLGRLYQSQGKVAEAEEMFNRARAGKEKALGKPCINS